jgi:copper(I)-binding protein
MKYITFFLIGLAVCLGAATPIQAQSHTTGSISIDHPWARATPAGTKTGAAYVTLTNHGKVADRLIRVSTPFAEKVQFHMDVEENGVMRMRELFAVDIGPGTDFTFKPGGAHMMLVGLKQPLKEGQLLPLTLEFEKAGKIDVQAPIAKVGAIVEPAMNGMQH